MLYDLYYNTPNSTKLKWLVLGASTAGAAYFYSSSPTMLAQAAAWNLGGKLLMRCVSNSLFRSNKYEHILIKFMDVPVNIATTTMFDGLALTPLFTGFELAPKFARALAYGVFGEIIKEFSDSAVNNIVPPIDRNTNQKPSLLGYFLTQLVKFTFTPLNYASWKNVLEYALAGSLRNMTNEASRGNSPWNLDSIAMGAIAYPAYFVLASAYKVTSLTDRFVLGVSLDCAERIAYHFSKKPITAVLNAVSGNGGLKRD